MTVRTMKMKALTPLPVQEQMTLSNSINPSPLPTWQIYNTCLNWSKRSGMLSLGTQLDVEDLARLQNPTEEELDIDDPYFCLSLDMYLLLMNISQEIYRGLVTAINKCHPEGEGRLLSYDQIKQRVKNFTGILPIHNDLCIKSCMAFTGPYKDLNTCLHCHEPRYDPVVTQSSSSEIKKPQQYMTTIPIGPQIQVLWSHRASAEKMDYQK
jgi:hypothetical protein